MHIRPENYDTNYIQDEHKDESSEYDFTVVDMYLLLESLESFLSIMPTILGFILSWILCRHMPTLSTRRFLMEFIIIGLPTVIFATVGSDYSYIYCTIISIAIMCHLYRTSCPSKTHIYEIGKRPLVFSLIRATAYNGTSVAILAVDFRSFPDEFTKSVFFGTSAMDMGIGLFVVIMGLVSRRARNFSDLRMLPQSVVPLMILGVARNFFFYLSGNVQEESEYGRDLNAFYILGFTKLLGSVYSLLAKSDKQLLGLSLGLLSLHELVLQLGISDLVMEYEEKRLGFISANREGLSSLNGCAALYMMSMCFAKWYTDNDHLSYNQLCSKLKKMLRISLISWVVALLTIPLWDICRVTFNFGYVIWVFAISVSLILIYAFVFELLLSKSNARKSFLLLELRRNTDEKLETLPTYVKSLNMNGLTHFIVSNLLTGLVKFFLNPAKRNGVECVLIVSAYMFINALVVFTMLKYQIRMSKLVKS